MSDVADRYENDIELLVDGELTDERRRQLLLSCENQPERWREVALAFVEAQILRTEVRSLVNDVAPSAQKNEQPILKRSRYDWLNRPWALAAAVLVSIGAGFGLGALVNSIEANVPAASHRELATADAAVDPVPNRAIPSGPKTVQLVISEPDSNQLRPVEVPLVPASRLDEWASTLPRDFLPDDIRRTLQQLGHEVKHKRQLIPVALPDGSRALVPVDNVSVDYLGDFQ